MTVSETDGAAAKKPTRNVLSGTVGTVLEWYDFAIYGMMAPIIADVFFPSDDEFASLLLTFSVFAAGYLARPLGGIFLGYIGDRLGRKRALMITVVAMGVTSAMIGLLPGHAQIGIWASVLLLILRVIQGLCVGGEYPGSVVFLVEHAPPSRRGRYATWIVVGSMIGFMLSAIVVGAFTRLLGDAAMGAWGWRLPFFLGALVALSGVYLRRNMSEPKIFLEARKSAEPPLTLALKHHWRVIVRIIALSSVYMVGFYLIWVYAISYLEEFVDVPHVQALEVNFLSICVMIVALYFSGMASDRFGRLPFIYAASIGTIVFAVPLWWVMSRDNFTTILLAQSAFAVLHGIGMSSVTTVMAELLPTQVRFSAASLGYNVSVGFFGGMTPLAATWLTQATGSGSAPASMLAVFGAVSLSATIALKETRYTKLAP